MSKWPMRGHFRYLRFKTFPMTLRTPQCEVFWALLSSSKHSGVPEDSKFPTLGVLGFTPTLGPKWGCDILHVCNFFFFFFSILQVWTLEPWWFNFFMKYFFVLFCYLMFFKNLFYVFFLYWCSWRFRLTKCLNSFCFVVQNL